MHAVQACSGGLMSLSDLAALGSFVSGLAVLVSLIFLYFQLRQVNEQVRQTEKNQRALLDQGATARNEQILTLHAQPHINELTAAVISGRTDFAASELGLLATRFRTTMLAGQDTYVQHKAGLADAVTLENMEAVVRGTLAQPVYRAIWRGSRRAYSTEWQTYVDRLLEGLPLAGPADSVALFKSQLDHVMAEAPISKGTESH